MIEARPYPLNLCRDILTQSVRALGEEGQWQRSRGRVEEKKSAAAMAMGAVGHLREIQQQYAAVMSVARGV